MGLYGGSCASLGYTAGLNNVWYVQYCWNGYYDAGYYDEWGNYVNGPWVPGGCDAAYSWAVYGWCDSNAAPHAASGSGSYWNATATCYCYR